MPRELFRSGTGPILTGEITAKLGAAGIRWCMADCRRPEAILEMLWHIALLDTDALPARYISGACGDGIAASEMYSGNPVETYLKRSGFSPMLSGYIYLTEAAELAADENECQGAITKHIYPEIADRHVKSAESIERAIRFAIESAWQSGRLEGFRPWSHGGSLVKPTNAEMIFRLGRIAKNAASGEKTA